MYVSLGGPSQSLCLPDSPLPSEIDYIHPFLIDKTSTVSASEQIEFYQRACTADFDSDGRYSAIHRVPVISDLNVVLTDSFSFEPGSFPVDPKPADCIWPWERTEVACSLARQETANVFN
jgi:hypothetical protein